VIRHLPDIESDLSAVHRIDDMWSLEAGKFFRLAHRLPAYQGVIRAWVEREVSKENRRTGGREIIPVPVGGLEALGLPVEKSTD
jgi:hypothetical protein